MVVKSSSLMSMHILMRKSSTKSRSQALAWQTTSRSFGLTNIADAAPNELSAIAMIMPLPPIPTIPAEAHGKLAFVAMMAFAGDPDAAQKALDGIRQRANNAYVSKMPPEGEHYDKDHILALRHGDLIDADEAVEDVELEAITGSDRIDERGMLHRLGVV